MTKTQSISEKYIELINQCNTREELKNIASILASINPGLFDNEKKGYTKKLKEIKVLTMNK